MEKYQKISQREHVLLRTGMYAGSSDTVNLEKWIFNNESNKIELRNICFNEAYLKIISEIIDNCIDNVYRNPPTTIIKISINGDSIKIENDGSIIPIVKNSDNIYIPTLIFGSLLSGSNYTGDQVSIGTNGIGAKLTNILSKQFKVTCFNDDKKFEQTWFDNMSKKSEPKITKGKNKMSTIVEFTPDKTRFQGFSIEKSLPHIHTRLIELASSTSVKIYFNGSKLKVNSFKRYLDLFKGKKAIFENEKLKFAIGISSNGFQQQSFVNAQKTLEGGSHVSMVMNEVVSILEIYLKKKFAGNKISKNAIKNKLHVFVDLKMKNPSFTSQTKVKLGSRLRKDGYFKDGFEKEILKKLKSSGIVECLEDMMSKKEIDNFKGKEITKKKNISVDKLIDARRSGTIKSKQCSLFLVEGDSAKTMVVSGFSVIKNEFYGVYPLKGKPLNTFVAKRAAVKANKEISDIMKIIGLQFGKDYTSEVEFSKLRYGNVIVLTDADVDGFHIFALIIAFFEKYFPSLLKRGFIQRFLTPVITATNRSVKHSFYDIPSFDSWSNTCENIKSYKIKYFKGLGTATRNEAISYFKEFKNHLKTFTYDTSTSSEIDLLFSDKKSALRKKWMKNSSRPAFNYTSPNLSLTNILDSEMHLFSDESLQRAIPSALDGLKESQRKILFASFKKFNSSNTDFKIAQLAAYVAEKSVYLHGEKSLQDAITKMTQNFVGSNNLNYLSPEGQTGSRMQLGNDAASPRYTYTKLMPYTTSLFHPSDAPLLKYRTEEQISIEPHHYIPIIPTILVNGANGIAVGFRTCIPQHSPVQLIETILNHLQDSSKKLFCPDPFYNSYKTNHLTQSNEKAWIFHGAFTNPKPNTIIIHELPVGISTEKFTSLLSKWIENKLIKNFSNNHPSENEICFEIQFNSTDTPALELALRSSLQSKIPKSCLNLLNHHGEIQTFSSTTDILSYFFHQRLSFYSKRKLHLISHHQSLIHSLKQKILFIQSCLLKDINLFSNSDTIHSQCISSGIDPSLIPSFTSLSLSTLSQNSLSKLNSQLSETQSRCASIQNTSTSQMYIQDLLSLKSTLPTYDSSNKKRLRCTFEQINFKKIKLI